MVVVQRGRDRAPLFARCDGEQGQHAAGEPADGRDEGRRASVHANDARAAGLALPLFLRPMLVNDKHAEDKTKSA